MLAEGAISGFLGQLNTTEDSLHLLHSLFDLLVERVGVQRCALVLQDFSGRAFRIHRLHPGLVGGGVPVFPVNHPCFRWHRYTHVDHLFLGGPTNRVGERELAESIRGLFAEFGPTLCFPLMSGAEQIGLVLVGDRFEEEVGLPTGAEAIAVLVRNLNLALSRLGVLDEYQATGLMSRGLAHDLQGVMTPLCAYLELAGEGVGSGRDLSMLLVSAKLSLEKLKEYVEMARPAAPGGFKEAPLVGPIHRAMRLVSSRFEERCVRLEMLQPGQDLWVRQDEALLARLMNNLLINALQACPPQGRVRVECDRIRLTGDTPEWVRVRVVDDGIGVSPERLREMLDTPFGSRSARESSGGFGVGLAICRRIARMHGGSLTLRRGELQGTVVELDLPEARRPVGS